MKNNLYLFVACFLFSLVANAAYFTNIPVEIKQPNGQVIQCYLTGDEFHRRLHDKNNYTIIQNQETGFYVYASLSEGKLVPTDYIAGKDNPALLPIKPNLDISAKELEENRTEILKSLKVATPSHTKGNFYNLVLFIQFADDNNSAPELSLYQEYYNSNEPDKHSLFNFFNTTSNEQLKVYSSFYPAASSGEIIQYKDVNKRNFYTAYSPYNSIGYKDAVEKNDRKKLLLSNALNFAKESIPATQILDGNNDGAIDNISFIIEGAYELWGDLLWPQAYNLGPVNIFLNGKKAANCNILIENFIKEQGLNVIYHEFFHSLGAPDLYRYTDLNIDPVGPWDLMGNYLGNEIMVYMKWKYGKWITEIPEITTAGDYNLLSVSEAPFACYKIPSPVTQDEYFILEYRETQGLLIYRIKNGVYGNAAGPPDEVYVYRPYGTTNISGSIYDATFGLNINHSEFDSESNPSCFLSTGISGQIDISNIKLNGNNISFTVNTPNLLPKPTNFYAQKKDNQAVLSWNPPVVNEYNLLGYNIYLGQNSSPLNSTLLTDTTFMTSIPGTELKYEFKLTAKYHEGESKKTTAILNNQSPELIQTQWKNFVSGNIVHQIAVENNYLWIAGGGLNRYNITTDENLNFNHANSGLPANDVSAVEIDKLGNKWIGMYSGELVKYDGVNWSTYKPPFQDATVMDIVIDSKNNVWVATWAFGLLKFDGKNWTVYNVQNSGLPKTKDGQMDNYIYCLAVDTNDNLWIGLKDNLAKFDGVNWTAYNSFDWVIYDSDYYGLPGSAVTSIAIDDFGIKWIGTSGGGVVKFDDEKWTRTGLTDGNFADVIIIDQENNKWVGCINGNKLFKINDDGVETFEGSAGIKSLAVDLDNNKWIGSMGKGLFKFNNPSWSYCKTGNSDLPSDRIWSVHHDTLTWIGTEQNGAVAFNGIDWQQYQMADVSWSGLPGVMQIGSDLNNNIWFASEHGIFKYEADKMENISLPLPSVHWFRGVVTDQNNNKWFATDKGVVFFNGVEWNLINTANSNLPSDNVTAIALGPDNSIWAGFGNTGSISKYLGDEWLIFTQGTNGPISAATFDLFFDKEGNLWASGGMCGIVSKYDGITWTHFYNLFDTNRVRQDENSQYWFARHYFGLTTYVDGNYISYKTANSGLPSDMVTTCEIDKFNNKWIGTYGGGLAIFNENGVKQPLTASAGPDRSVTENENVQLQGQASLNFNFIDANYKWNVPEDIILDNDMIPNPKFIAPQVNNDTVYILHLQVFYDGKFSEAKLKIEVKKTINIPVANAGEDQTVNEEELVGLDGSLSIAPDGRNLTYKWTSPSEIWLNNPDSEKPSFWAPISSEDRILVFYLTVNDGLADSEPDEVKITVRSIHKAPVANAGSDQTVMGGTKVYLDGTSSFDHNNSPIDYVWTSGYCPEIPLGSETWVRYGINGLESDTIIAKEGTKILLCFSSKDESNHIFLFTDKKLESILVMFSSSGCCITFIAPEAGTYEYLVDNVHKGILIVEPGLLNSAYTTNPFFIAPDLTKDTTFTFSLFVNNEYRTSQPDHVSILVKSKNPAPVDYPPLFTLIPESDTLNAFVTSAINFQFNATDPEGKSVSYSLISGTGATLDSISGVFTYSPNAAGTYPFCVRVTDGKHTTDYSFSVMVSYEPVDNPPAFTHIPAGDTLTVFVTSAISFQFNATDPEGQSVSYSLVSGTGATLDNTSGLFNYSPTAAGAFPFILRVSDGTNTTDYQFTVVSQTITNTPISKNQEIKIFPNPTNGSVNISLNDIDNYNLFVYSSAGSMVWSQLNITNNNYQAELSGLHDGMYFIHLIGDRINHTHKIIIRK